MSAPMSMPMEQFVVNVPHVEARKFKSIVKALGFTITKRCGMDEAIEDIAAGRVYTYASVDDFLKDLD